MSAMNHHHHTRRRPTNFPLFAAEQNLNIERHAYCLCFHVRPATIFIALFHLGSSLTEGFVFMYMFVNSSTTPGPNPDIHLISGVTILTCFFFSLVASMMLYGVIKAKPSYLLPFFCIQFIEYLQNVLKFISTIYSYPLSYMNHAAYKYSSNVRPDEMFQEMETNRFSGHHVSHIGRNDVAFTTKTVIYSLLVLTIYLIFKTYVLSVVWKCYRYMHLREFILPVSMPETRHIPYDEPMMRSIMLGGQAPPPKYEDAIKYTGTQPPPYNDVLQEQQDQVNAHQETNSTVTLITSASSLSSRDANSEHVSQEQQQQSQEQSPKLTEVVTQQHSNDAPSASRVDQIHEPNNESSEHPSVQSNTQVSSP